MPIRVVRFSDVTAEQMDSMVTRIEESGGPPEGVDSSGITVLFDKAEGTAVVLQMFDSVEKMEAGAKILSAMDSADTPGTRVSVDACEVKLELTA